MALSTVNFKSYFNYKLSTKQITFTDYTDFVGQGTTAANVTVVAKVESPSGVFYNNTNHSAPDIDPDVSLDSTIVIPLPLDASSLPEQGLYTITLTYQDLVVPATVIEVKTFTLSYTSSTIDISMTVDCVTPQLKATDDTTYTKSSIDPTITRSFAIHYPPSTPTADVTGTASTLSTSTFYTVANSTVEHSSSLTSDLTYNFATDMYVIDQITGSKVIQVACNGDLCDIYCCIRSQWNRYAAAKGVNNTLANKELSIFNQITDLSAMVGMAIRCGKDDHISEYVTEILKLADCDAGCSCSDGTPQLVTGLAIDGDDVVVAEGTGVSVSTATGGGVTTYTVALSSVNINKLAAAYNSVVTAGTNITSVTSSSSTVGDVTTTTYIVNATDTIVESLFVRALLTFSSGVVPVTTIVTQKEYGTTFATINQGAGTEFILNNNEASYTDWGTNNTSFTIGNFFSSSATYFPEVYLVNTVKYEKGDKTTWLDNLDVRITSMSANEFDIRFSDKNGNPVNGLYFQDLGGYISLQLIFKIQA